MDTLKALLARRTTALAAMQALIDAAEAEDRDLTDEEQETYAGHKAEITALDERIARLREIADERARAAAAAAAVPEPGPQNTPRGAVGDEPMTYEKGNGRSYLRDLAFAFAPGRRDAEALARLQRHAEEIRAADMNRTDGTGGEFVPPLWVIREYVKLARAARVTADLCRRLPLPPGTDSINLPMVGTGSGVAEQADGVAVQKTDMTTTSVSGAVTTLAGQQVFAMQLLDQSPINFDEVVFADLFAELAKQVDIYVLSKAAIGILNVSGIVSVSYTDVSPTVAELYPKVADGDQQIDTNRFLPPQARVMHPRRWAWMLAALDSNNRPLVVPAQQGPSNAFAGMDDVRAEGAVGTLQGLPTYIDPNVPTNLGAGTNEDAIITARFDDLFLYEGDVRSRVLFETDADKLQVRLQVWEYLAFIGGRYPKAIAKIVGTGLVPPTF